MTRVFRVFFLFQFLFLFMFVAINGMLKRLSRLLLAPLSICLCEPCHLFNNAILMNYVHDSHSGNFVCFIDAKLGVPLSGAAQG